MQNYFPYINNKVFHWKTEKQEAQSAIRSPPLREIQELLEDVKLSDPAVIATNPMQKLKIESDQIVYVSTIRHPRFLWND
jgi:FMN-dependent NADH-azoreductase